MIHPNKAYFKAIYGWLKKEVTSPIGQDNKGEILAFIIGFFQLLALFYTIKAGEYIASGILLITTVLIIHGNIKRSNEQRRFRLWKEQH